MPLSRAILLYRFEWNNSALIIQMFRFWGFEDKKTPKIKKWVIFVLIGWLRQITAGLGWH